MMRSKTKIAAACGFTLLAAALPVCLAANPAANPVNQGNDDYVEYQNNVDASLADGANPGAFTVDDGKALFLKPRGPKHKDLSTCDFGLGPGVLKGAYAQLPRYFKDTGRVQGLEGRLMTCMTTIQGYPEADIKSKFMMPEYKTSDEGDSTGSDLATLATYIAAQSNGLTFDTQINNPQMEKAYHLGEYMFFHRWGEMDLNCATCHGYNDRTVRGVPLPNLLDTHTAGMVMTAFPAYVIKDGTMRTQWWRNERCVMAMRLPWLKIDSDLDNALTTFMRVQASKSDVKINIPGSKARA